jgi:hypothetical protein
MEKRRATTLSFIISSETSRENSLIGSDHRPEVNGYALHRPRAKHGHSPAVIQHEVGVLIAIGNDGW